MGDDAQLWKIGQIHPLVGGAGSGGGEHPRLQPEPCHYDDQGRVDQREQVNPHDWSQRPESGGFLVSTVNLFNCYNSWCFNYIYYIGFSISEH